MVQPYSMKLQIAEVVAEVIAAALRCLTATALPCDGAASRLRSLRSEAADEAAAMVGAWSKAGAFCRRSVRCCPRSPRSRRWLPRSQARACCLGHRKADVVEVAAKPALAAEVVGGCRGRSS
ncbi:unnamed protein product [Urochloa humidicola]